MNLLEVFISVVLISLGTGAVYKELNRLEVSQRSLKHEKNLIALEATFTHCTRNVFYESVLLQCQREDPYSEAYFIYELQQE